MLIMIGKIVNTKGLKGEVKVLSSSDFKEERFKKKSKLTLKNKDQELEVEIQSWKVHKTFDILKFEGYNFIDQVEKFKNWYIYAPKFEQEVLAENQYFNQDLVGLDVYDENKKDLKLGKVMDVYDIVNRTYLDIKLVDGTKKKIPFVDSFIVNVDLEKKRLDLQVIEGLLND